MNSKFVFVSQNRKEITMIIYSSEFRTHVAKIDEQHQELIDLINIFDSVEEGSHTKDEIEFMIDRLSDYIVIHFSYEEELMKETGYPESEWHLNWHNGFVAQIHNLKKEFLKNGFSDECVSILDDFIEKWVLRHIKNVDIAFGNYINDYNSRNK